MFLAVCLMPAVHWLSRWGLPYALGAALVMLVVSGIGRHTGRVARAATSMQLLDEVPPATRYLQREVNAAWMSPAVSRID